MTSKYYLPFLDISLLIFFIKNFTNLETDSNFEFIHLALKQSFYLLRLTLKSTTSLSYRIKVSYFILFRFSEKLMQLSSEYLNFLLIRSYGLNFEIIINYLNCFLLNSFLSQIIKLNSYFDKVYFSIIH